MTGFEQRFREAFERLNREGPSALEPLSSLYHPDVYFEDPLQRLHGREAFLDGMRRLYRKLRGVEFHLRSVVTNAQGDEAHATWQMRFSPPLGPAVSIEGASHLRLRDGQILYHRDYWDLLSSIAESSPTLALIYRALSRRLA